MTVISYYILTWIEQIRLFQRGLKDGGDRRITQCFLSYSLRRKLISAGARNACSRNTWKGRKKQLEVPWWWFRAASYLVPIWTTTLARRRDRENFFFSLITFFTTEFNLGVIDPAAMALRYTEDLSLRQYKWGTFDWCPKSILVRSDEMNEEHRVCRVCTSSWSVSQFVCTYH